jgi:flagellar basal body-associated protein FliL
MPISASVISFTLFKGIIIIIIIIIIIRVMVGKTGTVSKLFRKHRNSISQSDRDDIKEQNKTAILATAHTLRIVTSVKVRNIYRVQ